MAVAATVAASGMASLDATIVNIALPHIGRDFGADVATLQWVLTGYLVTLASLILLAGALGDRWGRRRVFMLGIAWFATASVLCALAPSATWLVGARIVQGVGAALLTPGSLAILQSSFAESERGTVVGLWSGITGVAGAIGPFVGGALVDGPGWRWAFLLNLPVAAAALILTKLAVPESRDPHASKSLDLTGAALAIVILSVATWVLTSAGRRGWGTPAVWGPGMVATAGVVLFVRHTLRSESPLVPPGLFRDRTFRVVNLATVPLYGALGVTFFLVAYQLQVAAHWSALRAGTALLPVTVLMLVLSAPSGALSQRIGPRLQLTAGPVLAGSGLVLLARIGPSAGWASDVLPGASLLGLGLAVFVAPLTATMMASAPSDHVNIASGVNNAIARAAGLAAVAVVPTVTGLARAAGAVAVTTSFRNSLLIAAGACVSASPLAWWGLPRTIRASTTAGRAACAVDGPPLQA